MAIRVFNIVVNACASRGFSFPLGGVGKRDAGEKTVGRPIMKKSAIKTALLSLVLAGLVAAAFAGGVPVGLISVMRSTV